MASRDCLMCNFFIVNFFNFMLFVFQVLVIVIFNFGRFFCLGVCGV